METRIFRDIFNTPDMNWERWINKRALDKKFTWEDMWNKRKRYDQHRNLKLNHRRSKETKNNKLVAPLVSSWESPDKSIDGKEWSKIKEKLFFGLQKMRMTTRTPPWIVEMLQENEKNKEVEPTMKNNLKSILENIWLMKFILTSNFKNNLGIAPGKLEESGKIPGKDLWVKAHSRETPLKWF